MWTSRDLNLFETPSGGSQDVDNFSKIDLIGEGTYGDVYMARDRTTYDLVALKRLKMYDRKEGIPITVIREIKLLQMLNHVNVIKLKEVVTSKESVRDLHEVERRHRLGPDANLFGGDIYLVLEYMDHDLAGLMNQPGIKFSVPQIKCYLKQLLTGLHYCHTNQVLHRDIKGANILIDNHGVLKLADFGMARSIPEDPKSIPDAFQPLINLNNNIKPLTNEVISLWYRPPELLLGTLQYTEAVDMWSVGCVFAEILYGRPVFQGNTEEDQLVKILEICGSYNDTNWPGVSKLPNFSRFKKTQKHYKRRFRKTFSSFDRHVLDLLERMLTMDPAKRITTKDALDAEYFWQEPLPCLPESLPRYETFQERRARERSHTQR